MSLQRLNEIAVKAAKALHDNEKFAIGVLAVRARRVAEAYPLDQTAIGMSAFLNKRAESSNQIIITRADLRDAYTRLYTRGNKFAEVFQEELGITAEKRKTVNFSRNPLEGQDLMEKACENLVDPILKNSLASILDPNIPYKPYSDKTAVSAERSCLHELNRLGVIPKKIDVVAGQQDILLCQAAYETPKGTSSVLIPVEIKTNKALLPTVFLSTAGFRDLNAETLTEHLRTTVGKNYQVNAQKVLEAIVTAKNGTPEPISDVEYIVMKASASKGTPAYNINGIVGQEINKIASEVKDPIYEQPQEVQEIAKHLTSKAGSAGFLLGKDNVELGRKIITQAMTDFGYKNCQVAVADNNKDTIFYAVSVDHTTGFRVPIKLVNKKIQYPSVIFANERMVEFSKHGISELLSSGDTNYQAVIDSSTMCGFSSNELIHSLKNALQNRDYLKAEEALAILQTSGDSKAYHVGYDLYTMALKHGDLQKTASVEKTCDRQYKTPYSNHMICAHTNLPLQKVYQDRHGNCRPKYRQHMDDTPEGGSFLHSKIFLG